MAPIALNEANGHANGTSNKPARASKYHAASSDEAIHAEHTYAAHNYHPLPIVFAKALGTKVWDPEGREYLDFLSAYSAVNQGHCHPELVKALVEQASTLTLSSRAFYNDVFPRFAEFVTKYFKFDMVLPMNTGAEAVETAIKIARKWGYKTKGIPQDQALILSVAENFHGRTVSCRPIPCGRTCANGSSSPRFPCPQTLSLATTMVHSYQLLAPPAPRLAKSSNSTMPKRFGRRLNLTAM